MHRNTIKSSKRHSHFCTVTQHFHRSRTSSTISKRWVTHGASSMASGGRLSTASLHVGIPPSPPPPVLIIYLLPNG
ncbi:unnamed protein product [Nezara viridula]|uniref:Uncharacterized protein n=1 Tax=Nezara viridula TaxID=85310 RepID=A0A9P0EBR2_NEZVI|nr:unnamed protein product [Nezara viridula]